MPGVQLRILGRTELAVAGKRPGSNALRQPKRLALLAYLSLVEPNGFRRRDQITALLWPEQDQMHARTQLRKALYAIRGAFGTQALVTRGEDEVRLDPDRVWCDAVVFRQHCQAGEWLQATALYHGDLLEGLEPGGVGAAFQRWLDEQRSALRYLASRAEDACAKTEAGPEPVVEAPPTPVSRPEESQPVAVVPRRRRRRWMVAALGGISVVLSLAAFAAGARFDPPPERATIAVLPFNGFADPTAIMIGQGMAEELTAALTQIQGISVRSTARSRDALRTATDLRDIGRQLAVAHLVDGSVQRSHQRLHVTIRLVRASDGMSLWAQSYDFRPNDPIEAQAEVARASVPGLTPHLVSRTP